jgi:hypothetical protein
MKKVRAFTWIALLLPSLPLRACSCGYILAPLEAYRGASAVFTGTVLFSHLRAQWDFPPLKRSKSAPVVQYNLGLKDVLFEVDRVWKGVEERQVLVTTGSDQGACGYPFEEGQKYLVYAYDETRIGLNAGLCGRTQPYARAGNDLAAIGPPSDPPLRPSSVWKTIPALNSPPGLSPLQKRILGRWQPLSARPVRREPSPDSSGEDAPPRPFDRMKRLDVEPLNATEGYIFCWYPWYSEDYFVATRYRILSPTTIRVEADVLRERQDPSPKKPETLRVSMTGDRMTWVRTASGSKETYQFTRLSLPFQNDESKKPLTLQKPELPRSKSGP